MGQTSIEWTDHTVNPIRARNRSTGKVGHFCEKISPGCGHCYASEWNENRFGTGLPFLPVWRDSVEPFLDRAKLDEVLRRKRPTRYFWCDMTDLFLDLHPDAWIDECFAVMARTPQHTHQVLTKRPGRMAAYLTEEAGARVWGLASYAQTNFARADPWPLPNVWLGASVEDQQRADERVPLLLRAPAAVRFLSCEPLLGPVDLGLTRVVVNAVNERRSVELTNAGQGVDWVIIGGESGPDARPMRLEWARSLVRQCAAAGLACFVKQLGSNVHAPPGECSDHAHVREPGQLLQIDRKGGAPEEWPEDLRVRQFPSRRPR